MDVLGPLKEIAINDPGIRTMLIRDVGLEAEELGFLIDAKIDSKVVKESLQAALDHETPNVLKIDAKTKKDVSEEVSDDEEQTTHQPDKNERPAPVLTGKKPQSNLFDF